MPCGFCGKPPSPVTCTTAQHATMEQAALLHCLPHEESQRWGAAVEPAALEHDGREGRIADKDRDPFPKTTKSGGSSVSEAPHVQSFAERWEVVRLCQRPQHVQHELEVLLAKVDPEASEALAVRLHRGSL